MGGWLALIVTIHTNVTDSSRQNGPILYESLYVPLIVAIITLKYKSSSFASTSLEILNHFEMMLLHVQEMYLIESKIQYFFIGSFYVALNFLWQNAKTSRNPDFTSIELGNYIRNYIRQENHIRKSSLFTWIE